jgi:hypothetical protein
MALSPRPASTLDIGFFRNTGLALVIATLAAGAITLSLALTESQSIVLAQKAQTNEAAEIMAEVTGSVVTANQRQQSDLE